MKKAFLIALAVGVSASVCCAFYNPSDPYFIRLHKESFSGKKPREIARFLAHPDTLTQKGAVAALAETPDAVLPLVEKLLTDENVWIRAGAVDVLAQIVRNVEEVGARPPPVSSGVKANVVRLLNGQLAEETSPQVLHSVCQLFRASTFDPEIMSPFVSGAALSRHPDTRKAAMQALSGQGLNEDLLIQTALTVMEEFGGSINEEVLWAAVAFDRAKKHPSSRAAIPAVAAHLRSRVNSGDPPFRKQAWFQVVDGELGLLEAQWEEETEQMTDVVPALCRSVVRLPRGKTRFGDLKGRAERLLESCSAVSAGIIRASAEQEAIWLEKVGDADLLRIVNGFSAKRLQVNEARSECRRAIRYLEMLAEQLEAGIVGEN